MLVWIILVYLESKQINAAKFVLPCYLFIFFQHLYGFLTQLLYCIP